MKLDQVGQVGHGISTALIKTWVTALDLVYVLFDFSHTVKAAPHECVIRTGQPWAKVKAENEVWFYSKVTVSSCVIISV